MKGIRATVVWVAVFAACHKYSAPAEGGKILSSANGASVTANFAIRGDRLQIQYAIRNNSPAALYVADAAVIVNPNGKDATVETARPDAEFSAPDVLLLYDKLFPLPPGMLTTVPPSAYSFRVEQGDTHSRRVELALPLRDRRLRRSKQAKLAGCGRIRFEVGIIFPGGGLTEEEQVIGGTTVWRLNTAAYRQQQVLSIEAPLPNSVAIETEY
jgi:hypothetical protein